MRIPNKADGAVNSIIYMISYLNNKAYLNSFKCDKERWVVFISYVTIIKFWAFQTIERILCKHQLKIIQNYLALNLPSRVTYELSPETCRIYISTSRKVFHVFFLALKSIIIPFILILPIKKRDSLGWFSFICNDCKLCNFETFEKLSSRFVTLLFYDLRTKFDIVLRPWLYREAV